MDPLGYTNPHVMNPFNLQDFNGLSAFGNAAAAVQHEGLWVRLRGVSALGTRP